MNNDSPKDLEQRSWLAQHLAGDKLAFNQLMQAYRKPIYSYLVRSGFDRNTRDDLFQDIFFKIHKSAKQYNPSKRLSPWIFTIAINTLRNFYRDNQSSRDHISIENDESVVLKLVDQAPTPESRTQSKHQMQWLQQELLKLPNAQGEALNLVLINGLKLTEAAKLLNLPLSTVKSRVRRARQSLIASYQIKNSDENKRSIS